MGRLIRLQCSKCSNAGKCFCTNLLKVHEQKKKSKKETRHTLIVDSFAYNLSWQYTHQSFLAHAHTRLVKLPQMATDL